MKTNVKEFHEDCVNACCQCPQCCEINLPEMADFNSPLEVIQYWTSDETYGGHLLNCMGYSQELSGTSKEILKKVEREIENALTKAFK